VSDDPPAGAAERPVTSVDADAVTFRLPHPPGASAVTVWSPLDLGGSACTRVGDRWELTVARPPVDRLEYLFEVTTGAGPSAPAVTTTTLDPGNPLRVGGAFGDHSWLAFPGYAPPGWLRLEPVAGERTDLTVEDTPVGPVAVTVWEPADAGPEEALPLLVSHDGPEMDELGGLTRFLGALVAAGRLPRLRAALVTPGARNAWYSASPDHSEALVGHVLPALAGHRPGRGRPVLMGQSLGALAALHAEWTHPGTFAGLFLQSGSFFTPELDPQEKDFELYGDITAFTAAVHGASEPPSRPVVTVVHGTAEENAADNDAMAATLTRLGLDVGRGAVRDAHNWTCWRDLLDPHLPDLLARARPRAEE
jgi:enterochelin esterase-like enzyme